MKNPSIEPDLEIAAISAVFQALKRLDSEAQSRVLNYVAGKLKIAPVTEAVRAEVSERSRLLVATSEKDKVVEVKEEVDEDLEGISPVAKKWMTRSGLNAKRLSSIFSLGVNEIDLVSKTVPGKGKKEKMRSVCLLKGVAAYLSAGAARFTHEQIKETCLHYDAFDPSNFAAYFKSLLSEVSGNKDTGYALTARGLASATEMVQSMTQASKAD